MEEFGIEDNGTTPLFLASSHGHLEVVEHLLEARADKDSRRSVFMGGFLGTGWVRLGVSQLHIDRVLGAHPTISHMNLCNPLTLSTSAAQFLRYGLEGNHLGLMICWVDHPRGKWEQFDFIFDLLLENCNKVFFKMLFLFIVVWFGRCPVLK